MSNINIKQSLQAESLKKLTVKVPGSSANLGPGFDTLAIALKIYCTVDFCILKENDPELPLISLRGASQGKELARDKSNLIYAMLAKYLNDEELLEKIRISIDSEIPLGRGLGSSAAAIASAAFASLLLAGSENCPERALEIAAEVEGHADNAAASIYGGLVITSFSSSAGRFIVRKIAFPADWACVLVVPPYQLATKKARAVLPSQVSRQDAVSNLQKLALLQAACQAGDVEAMKAALKDERLHEPYRAELVPELHELKKTTADLPVIGTVLSGAGPSVLNIVERKDASELLEALASWNQKRSSKCRILNLDVDEGGLNFSYE